MKVISVSDPSELDQLISALEKPGFLKVQHPSCGHCMAMKPAWDKLTDYLKDNKDDANLIELHADILQHPKFREKFPKIADRVAGYPTLMIIENGIPSIEYNGDRSFEDMLQFCKEHLLMNKNNKTGGGFKRRKSRKSKKRGKSRKPKKSKKRVKSRKM